MIILSNLTPLDNDRFENIVQKESVFYLYLHSLTTAEEDIVRISPIAAGVYTHQSQSFFSQAAVQDASKVLLGHPTVYQSSDPHLFRRFALEPSSGPVLLSIKDHSAKPYDTLSLAAFPKPAIVSKWLQENRYPTVEELSSENFQGVMRGQNRPGAGAAPATAAGAQGGPIVVLAAIDQADRARGRKWAEEMLLGCAQTWKARTEKVRGGGAPVRFVWMNVHLWGDWLKKTYGVTTSEVPRIIIADHTVSATLFPSHSGH